MARLVMPRMKPFSRKDLISAVIVATAVTFYLAGLKVMDTRAASYIQQTRSSDPDLYLEQLRASHGFTAYLPEYAALKKFEGFTPYTPEFLIGRWTMRDQPMRLAAGERPHQCSDPITFDYGLLLMVEPAAMTLPVNYRIANGKVLVRTVMDDEFEVTPVSFGAQIDRLELVPPGRSKKVFAYFCGS